MDNGKDIKELIQEIDADNVTKAQNLHHHHHRYASKLLKLPHGYLQDGRINYDEFAAMMRKGNPEAAANPKKRRNSIFT